MLDCHIDTDTYYKLLAMEIGFQVLLIVQKCIYYLTWPLYWALSLRPTQKLPAIRNEILFQSAVLLAKRIRQKEITSFDVVSAYIARIKDVNPYLNAVVQQRFQAALEDARRVDALVASGSLTEDQMEVETPFLGVPFTVKESCRLKGMSLSVGSLPRLGATTDTDGVAVSLFRKSGAIPLAVTNTPELCYSWESENLITGRTLNPYDTHRTSGGSSGGEGALLGSAASVIGLASDLAGSIRIPALYNGIFGHKPTPNVVTIAGHFPPVPDPNYSNYLVIGPLARYAEDLKPMLNILAGTNADKLRLSEAVDVQSLKVFYMQDARWSLAVTPVDKEIKVALQNALDYLHTDCGLVTEKLCIKEMDKSFEISMAALFALKGIPIPMTYRAKFKDQKKSPNLYIEFAKSIFGMSFYSHFALAFHFLVNSDAFIAKSKYEKYAQKQKELAKIFLDKLKDDCVLLYPTHPTTANYRYQSYMRTSGLKYPTIFSVLGMPSTHVPLGLNKKGLPIGIQVVAAPFQDRLCLAVAEKLEAKFGGWTPPPSS